MGVVVRHEACEKCQSEGRDNSGNNRAVYDDGSFFCFACNDVKPSDDWLKENGKSRKYILKDEYNIMGREFNKEIDKQLKEECEYVGVDYRRIRDDTLLYFKVLNRYNEEGELTQRLYPVTKKYKMSGYKVRTLPKDFKTNPPFGETGVTCDLFGQIKYKTSNSRDVLIVGGEEDQLAAAQMLMDYQKNKHDGVYETPVVSPTIGENCKNQLKNQYEWLNRFDRIILCLDNDEAGKAAMEEAVKVLPKGKVFIMEMSYKDPCEYLKNMKEKEFIATYFKAKPYVPNGVLGSGELYDKIMDSALVQKIPLPPFADSISEMFAGGIPLGSIVNLIAASGVGKTTIANEFVHFWIFNSPHKIGVISLEASAGEYGKYLLSRHIGRKLDLIEEQSELLNVLSSEYVVSASNDLFKNPDGTDRFMLIDERDGTIEQLKEQILQLIIQCECKVIVLDPLQDILDGMSNEEQAVFMKWQKGIVKSHSITFININHVRKSGNSQDANSTGASLHEEDIAGSSTIFKSASCNMIFTRNKEAESEFERNVIHVKITKCRWTGKTSPNAATLYYDNRTHKIYSLQEWYNKDGEQASVKLKKPEVSDVQQQVFGDVPDDVIEPIPLDDIPYVHEVSDVDDISNDLFSTY